MSPGSPRIPPELEREIFEILASVDPDSVSQLILVAQRVKIWVEKYLYPIIILSYGESNTRGGYPFHDSLSQSLSRFNRISPSILENAVYHLFLDGVGTHRAHSVLSSCKAVRDLWINCAHSSLLDLAGELRLQRLQCDPLLFFRSQRNIDFGHPIFSHITHLELFFDSGAHNQEVITSVWTGLAVIPHLTHVAFSESRFLSTVAPQLLKTCGSLRVLIFLPTNVDLDAHVPNIPHLAEDVRFVQIIVSPQFSFLDDWKRGALGGRDYWSQAEALIARRRNGEIPVDHFVLKAFVGNSESSNELAGDTLWLIG
ncbi:hypothetical protein FB45DRAFT_1064529 [Roridomyces roridus]|uniref:Uncharacterized protein n=1 Tax=Roridomyces roridus TaxID=1738132 RepID=A0AAD7BAR3_9AGAR|nr:hypothetical protein FB45DRAFT_1064529 [Roridomyces roridus]